MFIKPNPQSSRDDPDVLSITVFALHVEDYPTFYSNLKAGLSAL